MRSRYVTRPTRRQLQAQDAFASGDLTKMPAYKPPRAPRKQAESKVNDAIIKAGRYFGSVLFRNRRGMVRLPNGGMFPYGLGHNGYPDNVGYTPVRITADMVGRQVAVFTAIEAKTATGTVASHQQACIDELKAHGCIAGVAVCGEDVRGIIKEWEGK
jgi:hypothetical protein